MILKAVVVTIAFVASFASPLSAFACGEMLGWAVPTDTPHATTISDVISHAAQMHDVQLEPSHTHSRCTTDVDYDVIDRTTKRLLGTIPVPESAVKADDGRFLLVRVRQLLATPREQLLALDDAMRLFNEDAEGLREEFGIVAYIPVALPVTERSRNSGQEFLIYVALDIHCTARSAEGPSRVSEEFYVQGLEFVPGRALYPAADIYKKGDLKKAIFSDVSLMQIISSRIDSNALHCADDVIGQKSKWLEVQSRLRSSSTEDLIRSSVDRFRFVTQRALSASMINANRIVVTYGHGSQSFAGTVEEMVAIQKIVERQGVRIDKRTHLDFLGKLVLRISKDQGRLLPASLCDKTEEQPSKSSATISRN